MGSGPSHWTTTDQLLFAALMMLALEVLKLVCATTGGEQSRTDPIRAGWMRIDGHHAT
jgi:hypothetical protein